MTEEQQPELELGLPVPEEPFDADIFEDEPDHPHAQATDAGVQDDLADDVEDEEDA